MVKLRIKGSLASETSRQRSLTSFHNETIDGLESPEVALPHFFEAQHSTLFKIYFDFKLEGRCSTSPLI